MNSHNDYLRLANGDVAIRQYWQVLSLVLGNAHYVEFVPLIIHGGDQGVQEPSPVILGKMSLVSHILELSLNLNSQYLRFNNFFTFAEKCGQWIIEHNKMQEKVSIYEM